MQIIRGLINLVSTNITSTIRNYAALQPGTVVVIGNYDGIHLGHQTILQHARQLATVTNLKSVLITFEPQPREYFLQHHDHKHDHSYEYDHHNQSNHSHSNHAATPHPYVMAPCRLLSWREKITLLADSGIDYLLILQFNAALAHLSANDFVRNILVQRVHARYIIIGEDFVFGAKHSGNIALLQQQGKQWDFEVITMPAYRVNNHRVSSSLTRKSLYHGDLATTKALLGRPYSVMGRIIAGDKRGRNLGIPTANIYVHHKIIPFAGVYAVRVWLCDDTSRALLLGVANIGFRPTVTTATVTAPKRLLEVHIFDFKQNIYGKIAKVEFMYKLRDEQKFASIEELKQQMARDAINAREYFARDAV